MLHFVVYLNRQQGPVGVQTCYCGPALHRLECRLARDKQEILQRLDSAHTRLDDRIEGLERKTQLQLQGLQRTVDSLGLESSAAGLQRIRNSIVLADAGDTIAVDVGGANRPCPKTNGISPSLSKSSGSKKDGGHTASQRLNGEPNDVQYTLDKFGLDVSNEMASESNAGLQALRNRLALSRIQEQKELDAIVEHYERRSAKSDAKGEESQSEESEDEENDDVLPLPVLSTNKSTMLSDSRFFSPFTFLKGTFL